MKNMSIIGRVGTDVTVKEKGDMKISYFSVAVNEKIKGEQKTEWISVSAFGKIADICERYLKKGVKVFASGNFMVDRYTTKDGMDKTSLALNANTIEMLDSKKEEASKDFEDEAPTVEETPTVDETPKDFEDDEIPF